MKIIDVAILVTFQVAVFVVLAMVLRRKPDVLIGLVPAMTRTSKYQGQEKLPLIVWLITQVAIEVVSSNFFFVR